MNENARLSCQSPRGSENRMCAHSKRERVGGGRPRPEAMISLMPGGGTLDPGTIQSPKLSQMELFCRP